MAEHGGEDLQWQTATKEKSGEAKALTAKGSWGFGRGTQGKKYDAGGCSFIGSDGSVCIEVDGESVRRRTWNQHRGEEGHVRLG